MATSDIIQYLSAKSDEVAASNRRVTETFYADGAIAVGDFVVLHVPSASASVVIHIVVS